MSTPWNRSVETPAQVPGPQAVVWAIYCLRDHGRKLDKASVLQSRIDCWLRIDARGAQLRARRYSQAGPIFTPRHVNDYGCLDSVRVVRLIEGGMLLRGTQFYSDDGSTHPQAWWCVIAGVRPWPWESQGFGASAP